MYALALWLYSLEPPKKPKPPDARLVGRGAKVFAREGCGGCHTPPLYTNNKLTPAIGFTVPADHRTRLDILPVVMGTDPQLTMNTRRGGGNYKVPSLRGLWYRGPFEHNGSVATPEDWLTQHGCAMITFLQDSKGMALKHAPFGDTSSACR